jgi:choline dehydrogenase-like flavoprotein
MPDAAFDVVVIGSGPGGGSVAWGLCRQGIKVALLEAGPAYDYLTDYGLERDDWERYRFPYSGREWQSYVIAPLQALEERRKDLRSWNHLSGPFYNASQRVGAAYNHVQGVGGTTLHYLGEAHRLHPQSMRMQSRHTTLSRRSASPAPSIHANAIAVRRCRRLALRIRGPGA